ncbi:unnamed protein product, partial [marine sediment metagenome]
KGGLFANRPVAPVSRDLYLATDSLILYVCVVDGVWKRVTTTHAADPDAHHAAQIDAPLTKEVILPFGGGGGGGGGFDSNPPEGCLEILNFYFDPVSEEQVLIT